jgi:predicted nucleic acid-binding Zn ribbon protein
MDFKMLKPGERKSYFYKCDRCGTETEFVCKLPDSCLYDPEPRGLGNGRFTRRCGGKYVFQREEQRA